jgi:methyltransferase (TIGR00027 family)
MKGQAATRYRAGVVIRARFVEDLVAEQSDRDVVQYVILGAGLDTFAQRKPELASRLQIFEVDRSIPQAWKKQRLVELGYHIPTWLHFVPVDFEIGDSWLDQLVAAGFNPARPTVIASTGVSMYLTKEAILSTLQQVATLAPGSTFAMTFLLSPETAEPSEHGKASKSRSSRKPFISFFTSQEMLNLAREAGFREVQHLSGITLTKRYFPHRMDSLPPSSAEEMLVATT